MVWIFSMHPELMLGNLLNFCSLLSRAGKYKDVLYFHLHTFLITLHKKWKFYQQWAFFFFKYSVYQ